MPRHILSAVVRSCRPPHWAKNLLILGPVLYAGGPFLVKELILTVAAFCFAASCGYVVNDWFDIEADRQHPEKSLRPLARSEIGPASAVALATALGAASVGLGLAVNREVAACVSSYLALSAAYSRWLKHMVLIDVFAIAGLFVLRFIAGATATQASISAPVVP